MPQRMTIQPNPMFRKDSTICRVAWALCAIATDLHFEVERITADIAAEDPHAFHERLYFFRGTLRGLSSAEKLLTQLRGDQSFRAIAERHGQYEAFEAARRLVASVLTSSKVTEIGTAPTQRLTSARALRGASRNRSRARRG